MCVLRTILAVLAAFIVAPIGTAHAQTPITGPWLWVIAPTESGQGGAASTNIDSLAAASDGAITEEMVAVHGAIVGDKVGEYAWFEASLSGSDINSMLISNDIVTTHLDDFTSYALIDLESPTDQNDAALFFGSDDSMKVWLNGEVVYIYALDRPISKYSDRVEVSLKAGSNRLLVKVSDRSQAWHMLVGLEAEFSVRRTGADAVILLDENYDDDFAHFIGGSHVASKSSDAYRGRESLFVQPLQLAIQHIPGWAYKIVENPSAPDEFRYITFAWKKDGGTGIQLQIHGNQNWWNYRYHAGANVNNWNPSIQVNANIPTTWTVVTRDLFEDWGPFTMTGMAFTPFDGNGGYWDAVFLHSSSLPSALVGARIDGPDGRVEGAFEVSIAFSHVVTDFTQDNLNVVNGKVTDLSGSGAFYAATIAPSKAGPVSVSTLASRDIPFSNVYSVNYYPILTEHTGAVLAAVYSPKDALIATASADDTIRLRDSHTGAVLKTLIGHTGDVRSTAFSPDGAMIATGSVDHTIRIWNVETGEIVRILESHTGNVYAVDYSPDGTMIVSGGGDNTVRLWDAKTGQLMRTLTQHTRAVRTAVFSPDGTLIASGSGDRTVRLWDAQSGDLLSTVTEHARSVYSVAFSPDGTALASGSADETICIWDVSSRELKLNQTLRGDMGYVFSVAFSPDGTLLASGTQDGAARLWEVVGDGRLIGILEGLAGDVYTVAFSPDGAALSVGAGNKLQIWPLDTEPVAVNISGPIASVKGAFNVTIAFSGKVFGFKPSHIKAVNGSVTSLSGSGSTYHATVAPYDPGKVTVSVRAKSVRHNQQASNAYSVDYDPTLKGHTGNVNSVAYSPDGQTLVSASDDNTIRIWNASTGVSFQTLTGHTSRVYSAAYSPDGTKIVSGAADGTVRVWNAARGALLDTLTGHTGWIESTVYSSDGTKIVSGSHDRTLRIWDAETGEMLRTLSGHSGPIYSAAYSPDGTKIVSGAADNTIRIWDGETGQIIHTLRGHGTVRSVAYSPDGTKIVSGGNDRTVRIWDADTGEMLRTLLGHTHAVVSVAYSPDGAMVVSGEDGGTIRIWSRTGEHIRTLLGHSGSVYSVVYSPDGTRIASGGRDNTIRFWQAPITVKIAGSISNVDSEFDVSITFSSNVTEFIDLDIEVENGSVTSFSGIGASYAATIKPSSAGLVSVSVPAKAARRNLASNVYTVIYYPTLEHTGGVLSATYSPNAAFIATGSADDTIRLWDAQTAAPLKTLDGHTADVRSVAFSPDSATLAAGSADHTIRIWNPKTGESIRMLEGHNGPVYSIAFSPDGKVLASGSADATLCLWDAQAGTLMKTIKGHSGSVRTVAFSPDGTLIASGGADKTVRLWDAQTGKPLASMKKHARTIYSVAFSPDGKVLASGSADETIRFWNVSPQSLAHTRTVGGSAGLVFSVAFSPDGSTLAAGNQDGTVQLWASGNGRLKETLEGHTGTVYAVAYSPDSQTLISGSRDKTLRFWSMPTPNLDVNGDGVVDAADLQIIADSYGGADPNADVNGDGVVDVTDVLLVADALANAQAVAAAPALASSREAPSVPQVSVWLNDANGLMVRSDSAKRGVAVLEDLMSLLAAQMIPSKTALLPNYPNPFNPETWIPFELADSSRVKITIYNSSGQTVRVLELGQLPAGAYRSRSKAAHWDGRNALGEPVASGVYYVRIEAGSFTALRRMVVLK